jgi:hypothetical protein
MSDEFSNVADTVSSPSTRGVAVTPDDSLPLANIPKALFIGEAGDLVMRGVHDTADLTFKNLAAGSILPFRAQFVRATGTTADSIVALF